MDRKQISKAVKAIGKWTILPSEFSREKSNFVNWLDRKRKYQLSFATHR